MLGQDKYVPPNDISNTFVIQMFTFHSHVFSVTETQKTDYIIVMDNISKISGVSSETSQKTHCWGSHHL